MAIVIYAESQPDSLSRLAGEGWGGGSFRIGSIEFYGGLSPTRRALHGDLPRKRER